MFGFTFARSYLPRRLYSSTRTQFATTCRGKLDNDYDSAYSANSRQIITSDRRMLGNAGSTNVIKTSSHTASVPIRFFSNSIKKEQSENSSSTVIGKRDKHWENMLNSLIEYREEYGDTLVPTEWELNRKLGTH